MYSARWWLTSLAIVVTLYVVGVRLSPSQPLTFEKPVKAAVLALEQTLAEVYTSDDGAKMQKCRLYEINSKDEEEKVMSELNLPRINVSLSEMLTIIEDCKVFAVNGSSQDEESNDVALVAGNGTSVNDTRKVTGDNSTTDGKRPWKVVPGILPGTKWCGMGDVASTYEELGPRRELDRCCRAHDHCPMKLKAFRSGWGLINFSLYTKSHCECDSRFYDCLKQTNTHVSNVLGNFYFNLLKVQCMKPQRPMVCAEKIVPLEGKSQCIRWKYVPHTAKMSFVNPERRY